MSVLKRFFALSLILLLPMLSAAQKSESKKSPTCNFLSSGTETYIPGNSDQLQVPWIHPARSSFGSDRMANADCRLKGYKYHMVTRSFAGEDIYWYRCVDAYPKTRKLTEDEIKNQECANLRKCQEDFFNQDVPKASLEKLLILQKSRGCT